MTKLFLPDGTPINKGKKPELNVKVHKTPPNEERDKEMLAKFLARRHQRNVPVTGNVVMAMAGRPRPNRPIP